MSDIPSNLPSTTFEEDITEKGITVSINSSLEFLFLSSLTSDYKKSTFTSFFSYPFFFYILYPLIHEIFKYLVVLVMFNLS